MRNFINTTVESITAVFNIEATDKVVTVMVKRGLRALSLARTLLVPFTGLAPVGMHLAPSHLPSADQSAAAARRRGHYCPGRMWRGSGRRPVGLGLGAGQPRS